MDFDEFRTAHRLPVLVLQYGDPFLGAGVEDVRRVGPYVLTIETKRDPAVTALGQLELALGSGGHFRGIENEQLFAHLITDPQFCLIGREGRAVCSVGDWRISGEDARSEEHTSELQ